jgi:hypothetical protein
MPFHCRTCQVPLKPLEVNASGGGGLMLQPTAGYQSVIEEDADFDWSSPSWLGRYLDGYPCFACDTVELAVADRKRYLDCEGRYLPHSSRLCPVCRSTCRGPLVIECDGVGSPPLAFLDHQYGAPLRGTLCSTCGRVWMHLVADDDEARTELARRFADSGPCMLCKRGRLRLTRVDVPHSGVAGLYQPAPPAETGRHREPTRVADLLVAVCDSCGEAAVRLEAGRAERRRSSNP